MSVFGQPRIRNGQILFCGEDISHKSTHYVATGGIAQAPEGRRIFPDMSVEENLLMGTIPSAISMQRKICKACSTSSLASKSAVTSGR